jgi:hypothetical protein
MPAGAGRAGNDMLNAEQRREIKAKPQGLDLDDKELRFYRLNEAFYQFPVDSLCVMNTKKNWYYLMRGSLIMIGPVTDDLKSILVEVN